MELPKISIITVVFNDHQHIEQTMLSVLNQTYNNVEYIVIDGGSKDGTINIIKKYADRLAYWVSEPDKGIYDAMNKAINKCTGKWVAFINSWDSIYNNDVLSRVFSQNDFDGIDVIYGDVCLATPYGRFIKKYNNVNENVLAFNLNHQATFTRADLLKRYKYDTSYRIAADMDFFNKAKTKEKARFCYVPVVLANYECGNGTSANSLWRKSKEYRRLKGIKTYSLEGIKTIGLDVARFIYYSMPFGLAQKATRKRIRSLYQLEEDYNG